MKRFIRTILYGMENELQVIKIKYCQRKMKRLFVQLKEREIQGIFKETIFINVK